MILEENEWKYDLSFLDYLKDKDPWGIPFKERKAFIQNIRNEINKEYSEKMKGIIAEGREIIKLLIEHQNKKKLEVLRQTRVIGLTSTGASMHRDLLNKLKAPVYIIEEAGELLECQLLACLNPHIENLILIGDEQQLRPKVNPYYLEKEKKFVISMFERLVQQGYPKETILTQLRMRPEI